MISDHFRREGKLMLALPVILIVIGLLAATVVPPVIEWLEIDSCFDRGGAWNHERGVCDYGEAQPASK